MKRNLSACFCTIALALLGSGCVHFPGAGELKYQLPDARSYGACFTHAGGACPAQQLTMDVSASDDLAMLESEAREIADAPMPVALSGKADRAPVAADAVSDAAWVLKTVSSENADAVIDGDRLADARASILTAVAQDSFDDLAVLQVTDDNRRAVGAGRFISEYLKAYFRSGRFAKVHLDPARVKERVKAELRQTLAGRIPDDQIEALAEQLTAKLTPKDFGVVNTTSFVARGGKAYQFKEITLTLAPGAEEAISVTKVDGVEVVGELTRVVFEGIFDSIHQLPAVANATGVTAGLGLIENRPCNAEEASASAEDCAERAKRLVSDDEFGRVESIASQIDGATLALTGSYLRGISWFSLNNEYLATFLETAVAVTARKNAEKLAWCYYTCKPDDVLETGFGGDARIPMRSVERTITEESRR